MQENFSHLDKLLRAAPRLGHADKKFRRELSSINATTSKL
jgi:hypothetical protein